MKRHLLNTLYSALFLGMLAVLAGCSSIANKESAGNSESKVIAALNNADRDAAVFQGRNIGNLLLQALKDGDFKAAEKLPIGDTEKRLPQEKFDELVKNLQTAGGIASYEYLGDLKRGNHVRLLWKVSFNADPAQAQATGSDMVFELAVSKLNEQFKALGFGFRM